MLVCRSNSHADNLRQRLLFSKKVRRHIAVVILGLASDILLVGLSAFHSLRRLEALGDGIASTILPP